MIDQPHRTFLAVMRPSTVLSVFAAGLCFACLGSARPRDQEPAAPTPQVHAELPQAAEICEHAADWGDQSMFGPVDPIKRDLLLADCVDQLVLTRANVGEEGYRTLAECLTEASNASEASVCPAPKAVSALVALGISPMSCFPQGSSRELYANTTLLNIASINAEFGADYSAFADDFVEACVVAKHFQFLQLGEEHYCNLVTCEMKASTTLEMLACYEAHIHQSTKG